MAKDDYDVLVFKILTYLYGCLKRKYSFDETAFNALLCLKEIPEEYLADVLYMMQQEKLIEGVSTLTAWGGTRIVVSNLCELRITADGIRYLNDNSAMNRIRESIPAAGLLTELVKIVLAI